MGAAQFGFLRRAYVFGPNICQLGQECRVIPVLLPHILPATPALVNNFPLHGEAIEWGVLGNGTLCMASEVGNVD